MNELTITKLESKIAFLERHIEEQDKVIFKMRGKIDQIVHDLESLKSSVTTPPQQSPEAGNERPPHY